jgi:hypothetical protein
MHNNQLVNILAPWNKGKLIGQKPPLKLHEIWSVRIAWTNVFHLIHGIAGSVKKTGGFNAGNH